MAKVDRIIELLETRIARGDYALTNFPPEMRLADEIGVSRMTARKAILHLIENDVLKRDASGRLAVSHERSAARPLHIGFLMPTMSSPVVRWRQSAEAAVKSHGGHIRSVTFFHWDDPVLLEAIESFDGVFIVPPAEPIPAALAARLRHGRAHVVVLDADYSALGLRSVDMVPPASVQGVLNHLAALGHREISAFNTQPMDAVIEERIDQWRLWLAAHGLGGQLINEPEQSYGQPLERAYAVASQRLKGGAGFSGTAVFCITLPAAMGLMRAMMDHGLTPGREISVCCANDEGMARFLCPSLTATQMPAPEPFLQVCVDWMAGGEWVGPLLKRPERMEIFSGESTGPPRDISASAVPFSSASRAAS